jgi:hypothetical protein
LRDWPADINFSDVSGCCWSCSLFWINRDFWNCYHNTTLHSHSTIIERIRMIETESRIAGWIWLCEGVEGWIPLFVDCSFLSLCLFWQFRIIWSIRSVVFQRKCGFWWLVRDFRSSHVWYDVLIEWIILEWSDQIKDLCLCRVMVLWNGSHPRSLWLKWVSFNVPWPPSKSDWQNRHEFWNILKKLTSLCRIQCSEKVADELIVVTSTFINLVPFIKRTLSSDFPISVIFPDGSQKVTTMWHVI